MLRKELALLIYEKNIVSVALFLYISSCYLTPSNRQKTSNKRHKYFHFDWTIYTKILHKSHAQNFLICAIKYLLESGKIVKNRAEIDKFISFDKTTFKKQFMGSLSKRKVKKDDETEELFDFDKYQNLIEESLKISEIIETLEEHPENVVDWIALSVHWKENIFELFQNKSEYIVFTFFLNLNFKM